MNISERDVSESAASFEGGGGGVCTMDPSTHPRACIMDWSLSPWRPHAQIASRPPSVDSYSLVNWIPITGLCGRGNTFTYPVSQCQPARA